MLIQNVPIQDVLIKNVPIKNVLVRTYLSRNERMFRRKFFGKRIRDGIQYNKL
jgi:hypothetical protein